MNMIQCQKSWLQIYRRSCRVKTNSGTLPSEMDSLLYGLGIKRDVSSFDISTPNRYFLPLHFRITLAFGDSRLLTPTHVMLYFILLPLKVKEYKCSSPYKGNQKLLYRLQPL